MVAEINQYKYEHKNLLMNPYGINRYKLAQGCKSTKLRLKKYLNLLINPKVFLWKHQWIRQIFESIIKQ